MSPLEFVLFGAACFSPRLEVIDPSGVLAVEMADATFDLRTDDGETVAGPGFMDLTAFGVRVDGEDLLVSLEVAGDVGDALSTSLHPEYWLSVTLPGTSWHSRFYALPAEDWSIAQQLDIWQRERIGTAEAGDRASSSGSRGQP